MAFKKADIRVLSITSDTGEEQIKQSNVSNVEFVNKAATPVNILFSGGALELGPQGGPRDRFVIPANSGSVFELDVIFQNVNNIIVILVIELEA